MWAMTLAAETADRLDDSSAEAWFERAMALDPSDPYLLGAWSDWLLDHGRPQEVVALLGGRTRIDPLLLRLALAEQATGNVALAGHVADLAARFEASRLRGDTVHRREEARFVLHLLHQPARALAPTGTCNASRPTRASCWKHRWRPRSRQKPTPFRPGCTPTRCRMRA